MNHYQAGSNNLTAIILCIEDYEYFIILLALITCFRYQLKRKILSYYDALTITDSLITEINIFVFLSGKLFNMVII